MALCKEDPKIRGRFQRSKRYARLVAKKSWHTKSNPFGCSSMFNQRANLSSLIPWLSLLRVSLIGALLRLANVGAFQTPIVQSNNICKLLGVMSSADNSGDNEIQRSKKQIILIRHGLSYMNEYIGANGINFGGPSFTDIFSTEDQESYYRDSPLSATGQEQARELHDDIESLFIRASKDGDETRQHLRQCLQDLDLVVVSPLTRAIQTAQLALLPHITSGTLAQQRRTDLVPFVALPLTAERLYLVSDIGTPRSVLKRDYDTFVDFDTGFPDTLPWDQPWWWSPSQSDDNSQTEYVEWRPTGQGQQYLCPGEPYDAFEQRMAKLCEWLNNREEDTIALVGHFGVFEWLLQDTKADAVKFGNCEIRVVPFEPMLRKAKSTLQP